MEGNFDDHIKSLLRNLKADESLANWDGFRSRLDLELPITEDNFDMQVKGKMHDYVAHTPIVPFAMLLDKMNSLVNEDSNFDDRAKELLNEYDAPTIGSSWALMEQKLNAIQGDTFNEEVKEKLEDLEVTYESSTWPVLSEKIDKANKLRRKIVITKITELAVLVLLLITAVNIGMRPDAIPAAPTVQEYLQKIQKQAQKFQILKQRDHKKPLTEAQDLVSTERESESKDLKNSSLEEKGAKTIADFKSRPTH